MINIYLLRHGKTQGKPALNGRTDVLVAAHHQDQICDKLMVSGYSFQHLISSPLKRCSDLARRLVANHAVRQCDFELGFQEMDFGCFDGVPFDELQAQWPILENILGRSRHTPIATSRKSGGFSPKSHQCLGAAFKVIE